jgi:hypothetical protein
VVLSRDSQDFPCFSRVLQGFGSVNQNSAEVGDYALMGRYDFADPLALHSACSDDRLEFRAPVLRSLPPFGGWAMLEPKDLRLAHEHLRRSRRMRKVLALVMCIALGFCPAPQLRGRVHGAGVGQSGTAGGAGGPGKRPPTPCGDQTGREPGGARSVGFHRLRHPPFAPATRLGFLLIFRSAAVILQSSTNISQIYSNQG